MSRRVLVLKACNTETRPIVKQLIQNFKKTYLCAYEARTRSWIGGKRDGSFGIVVVAKVSLARCKGTRSNQFPPVSNVQTTYLDVPKSHISHYPTASPLLCSKNRKFHLDPPKVCQISNCEVAPRERGMTYPVRLKHTRKVRFCVALTGRWEFVDEVVGRDRRKTIHDETVLPLASCTRHRPFPV